MLSRAPRRALGRHSAHRPGSAPRTLRAKLWRDLRQGRGPLLAILAVIALGTALFTSSYLAYENLRRSYAAAQARVHLADLTLDVTAVDGEQARRAAGVPGVAAAEPQLALDLPLLLADGRDQEGRRGPLRAAGHLLSIPLGDQPALDQLLVPSGRYPTRPDELLVERHFADYQGLRPGDTLQLDLPGGPVTLRVAGLAVSAEYLWVTRGRQDIFPSPAGFGVLFVPRSELATLGRQALAALPPGAPADPTTAAWRLAADPAAGNRLLVALRPGAAFAGVSGALTALLGPGSVLAATPRADLPGVQVLQLDVDGLQELAVAFPALFLSVAGFIVAALLFRRVDAERPLIGTMLALGLRPGALLRHYLAFGAALGLAGTVLGLALGMALGDALTVEYAGEMAIPLVVTRLDPAVLLVGAALGLVAPTLAALFPARRAARLAPATAMRPFAAAAPPRAAGRALSRLPLWLRLPLRDIGRHPWRATATAAGVGAALLLIIVTAGMLDSTQRGLALTFGRAETYDLRLDLLLPQPAADLRRAVAGQPGVAGVETLLSLPVQVRPAVGGPAYDTVLQGLPAPSPLLLPLDAGGRPLPPRTGAAVLTRTVAAKLKVRPGDRLSVRLLPDGPSRLVTLGALSDSMLGNALSMPLGEAQAAFGLPDAATTALVSTAPGRRGQAATALAALPSVAQVGNLAALRGQLDALLGLMYAVLAVMLLCGVVLAAAILFNTATLSIAERGRELATMRALGVRMAGVARLVTMEHALIALAGLAAGFPLGLLALRLFLVLTNSDLFALPFWLSPRTALVALLGVALVLLAAQWPALQAVARLNLAEAAKQRE